MLWLIAHLFFDAHTEEEDADDDPILEFKYVAHAGAVNRLRAMPQKSSLVCTWADTGAVHVWNLARLIKGLDTPSIKPPASTPAQTFKGHACEGFALDWSKCSEGYVFFLPSF